jgi:Domain of unknown function (DUF6538)
MMVFRLNIIGQREWLVSLRTSDPAVARQRAHAVALKVERKLADAKRIASPESAARSWKTDLLREDLEDRMNGGVVPLKDSLPQDTRRSYIRAPTTAARPRR